MISTSICLTKYVPGSRHIAGQSHMRLSGREVQTNSVRFHRSSDRFFRVVSTIPESTDQDMVTAKANRTGHSPARQDDREIALQQLSISDRRSVGSSRPVPCRFLTLQRSPIWAGFLLFVAGILTAPSARSVFYSPEWAEGARGPVIGVLAETCENLTQEFTVSSQIEYNISSLFECEGGEFNVSWSGVINVSSTITIGRGTTVRIFGESPEHSSSSVNSSYGLNVPQELTSAVARASTSGPFGPIFFVQEGELHLENVVIKGGNATTSTTIDEGGGVHAYNSVVSISGCIFEENFAELKGGGIFTDESTLILKDSVFRDNHAGFQSVAGDGDIEGDGEVDGEGGGIWVSALVKIPRFPFVFANHKYTGKLRRHNDLSCS